MRFLFQYLREQINLADLRGQSNLLLYGVFECTRAKSISVCLQLRHLAVSTFLHIESPHQTATQNTDPRPQSICCLCQQEYLSLLACLFQFFHTRVLTKENFG